jgi:hypothetical protein
LNPTAAPTIHSPTKQPTLAPTDFDSVVTGIKLLVTTNAILEYVRVLVS